MGAIDFITTGDTDATKAKKGLVLAPLDATGEDDYAVPEPEDPGVKEIEDCCIEWRAGRVKPYWIALNEPKYGSSTHYQFHTFNQKLTVRIQRKAAPFAFSYLRTRFVSIPRTQSTRPLPKPKLSVRK